SSVRKVRGLANTRRVRPFVEALEDRTVPATFTVTNLSDGSPGSLRDVIDQANVAPGADTIVFAPSLRGGTFALSFLNHLPTRQPNVPQPAGPSALIVFSPITIQGTGETITRAFGAPAFRLFQVTGAGDLTLRNLTLSNGLAQGGAGGLGGGGAGLGGGGCKPGKPTTPRRTPTQKPGAGGGGAGGTRFGGGGGRGRRGGT